MLQSGRPRKQIQTELDAFLQEQSITFTDWLCNTIRDFAEKSLDAAGVGLLLRAVRDAKASTQPQSDAKPTSLQAGTTGDGSPKKRERHARHGRHHTE